MGIVKEEPVSSTEPSEADVKAEPAQAKHNQTLKQPLLAKAPSGSTALVSGPRSTSSGLPAFRLSAEGLGGVRLAAVWTL